MKTRNPLYSAAFHTSLLGMALGLTSTASGQEPLFLMSDLLGTQTDGFRVRVVNSGSNVPDINVAESVLAAGSLPGNGRGLFGTLNFGGAGTFAGTVGYPAGAAGDNFGLEATGLINIPAPGTYVFGVDGDDGFRLRLGSALGTFSEFVGGTGNSNTRIAITFTEAGLQPLRLTHFENGGGEFFEFYARSGSDLAAPTTPGAFLVGDTLAGGLQSLATGQFFIRDVAPATGTLSSIGQIEAMLNGTAATSSDLSGYRNTVNMLDGGAAGNFGGDTAFLGAGARDNFGVEATGMIYISEAGTYTFNTRNDDGNRLQINGSRILNDDPGFHAPEDRFGQYTFTEAGFYDLRNVFLEAGGGAHMELSVAKGAFAAYDANAFRLVGDVANGGISVFSPKGWKGDMGGDFATASNWRDGNVAGGTDAFATFSIVDLTADRTVTLNAAQTLGNLRFGDIDATGGANNWTLAGSGSLNLDVAAGRPIIEVLNNRANLNLSTTGNDGLAKAGAGTLSIGTAAGFTGDVEIRKGTIELGTANALPTTSRVILGQAANSGKLALNGNSQTVSSITTLGTGTDNRVVGGNATTGQLTVNATAGQNEIYNGTLGGSGANENNFNFTKTGAGTIQLAKPSTYTGDTTISEGTVQLGLGATVSGSSLWLDANDTSRLNVTSGLVNQWADRSGNNRNANATGTARPTATTNALAGGRSVVNFDGNDAMAVDLSFLTGTGYTIFAVEGRTTAGQSYYLGTGPGATNQALHVGYRDNTTATLAQFASDTNAVVPGFTTQQFNVWSNVLDTTTGQSIFRNGTLAGTDATKTATMTAANNGLVGGAFTGAANFVGDLSEVLIYNRTLTAEERKSVEAYLALKWSTAAVSQNVLPATTNLYLGSAGTLELSGSSQTVASLNNSAGLGGTLRNGSGGNVVFTTGFSNADATFSGAIQDGNGRAISFVKEGTGTQTLAGSGIAHRGSTTVNGGKLILQDATSFGRSGATTTLNNNSQLEVNVGTGLTSRIGVTGNPTVVGTGSVTKSGVGNLILSGASSYSGETVVAGGLLRLDAAPAVAGSSLWLDASDSLTISTSGASVTGWADKSGFGRNATGAGVTAPTQLANSLVGNRNVLRFDGGDDRLSVDLSYLANSEYTIFAVEGRRSTTQDYFLGTSGGSPNNALHVGYRNDTSYTLAQYANDIDVTGLAGYTTQEFNIWSNVLDFSSGHAVYRNGTLGASSPNVTPLASAPDGRIGTGFAGGQEFNGDIAEILIFNRDLTTAERQIVEAYLNAKWRGVGSLGNDLLPTSTALKVNLGATLDLNGFSQTVASLANHTDGGGTVLNNGALGSVSQFTVGDASSTTFSGVVADGTTGGKIALTKTGSGTLTLSGANTYSAGTTVNEGRLTLVNNRSGSSNFVTNAELEFNNTATQQLSNGAITGSGNLIKSGSGQLWLGANGQPQTVALTGANSLIHVQGGVLRNEYGNSAWGANKADLRVNAGAFFDLWDGNVTVDTLNGSGTINKAWSGLNTLTIGSNDGTDTFAGTISVSTGLGYGGNPGGTLNLTKVGTGTQSLTGTTTVNGMTTVSAGTLILDGSHTGNLTTTGGTVAGIGTITGNVTSVGGILSPGNASNGGIGSLTVNGSVSLDSSSVISITINDETAGNFDRIVNSGSFDAGGATLDLVFNDTTFVVGTTAADLASATRYTFVTGPVTAALFGNATLISAADQAVLGLGGSEYKVNAGGQDFWLQQGSWALVPIAPVPEPTSVLLSLAGVCIFLRRRR